jgi:hypothetical protein
MAGSGSKPGRIHLKIIEVLKLFPDGATGGQVRQELEKQGLRPEDHTHLDRRKRDLKKWFVIEKLKATQEIDEKKRIVTLYRYLRKRKVIHGRCQMCGRSIQRQAYPSG